MSDDYFRRAASAFSVPSMAADVAGLAPRTAILRKKYRKDKDRSEWALMDSKGKRVLKWFGLRKPSHDRVLKEERRIQYFKHHGSSPDVAPPEDLWSRFPSYKVSSAPGSETAAQHTFKHLTYGVLPSEEDFDKAFGENVPSGTYTIQNDPSVGSGSFTSGELYALVKDLTEKWSGGEDEQAGDTASSILYTLGIEWI